MNSAAINKRQLDPGDSRDGLHRQRTPALTNTRSTRLRNVSIGSRPTAAASVDVLRVVLVQGITAQRLGFSKCESSGSSPAVRRKRCQVRRHRSNYAKRLLLERPKDQTESGVPEGGTTAGSPGVVAATETRSTHATAKELPTRHPSENYLLIELIIRITAR